MPPKGQKQFITRDWETPEGEVIPGKEYVRIVLEPATKNNSLLGGQIPSDSVISEWQNYLRVECPVSGKRHLLHHITILSAELHNN